MKFPEKIQISFPVYHFHPLDLRHPQQTFGWLFR